MSWVERGLCRCAGQVLAVHFPFSLWTDLSSLMESGVLRAVSPRPVSHGNADTDAFPLVCCRLRLRGQVGALT